MLTKQDPHAPKLNLKQTLMSVPFNGWCPQWFQVMSKCCCWSQQESLSSIFTFNVVTTGTNACAPLWFSFTVISTVFVKYVSVSDWFMKCWMYIHFCFYSVWMYTGSLTVNHCLNQICCLDKIPGQLEVMSDLCLIFKSLNYNFTLGSRHVTNI